MSAVYHLRSSRIPILRPSEPGQRVQTKCTSAVGDGRDDAYERLDYFARGVHRSDRGEETTR